MRRLRFIFAGLALQAAATAPFDLQGLINRQLAAGQTEITIPPGRYQVTPKNREHLAFRNLTNVTVIADGVEMICTETTRAVTIENCTNFTLRGLTIDYDPLPFTQGRIVSISPDTMVHEIELFDGYPRADTVEAHKYAFFDPETRRLKYGNYYGLNVEVLAPDCIRLTKSPAERAKQGGEKPGDLIVIKSGYTPGGHAPHAMQTIASTGTVLENITLYASAVFGFFETHCDGSIYRNCKIDRRSPETDSVKRDPRLRSLNADAYHSKFAKKGPQLLGCSAHWMGDDAVNICGAYHLLTKAGSDTLRVLAKQEMDIEPGDPVELITVDGKRVPNATVVSVRKIGPASADEKKQLSGLRLLPRIQSFLTEAYEVVLDRPVELPFGSVIGSMNRMGNGFSVKDCDFGNNRSRGILIKASCGEISGNRVENCAMQAIKISPEYQWLESGYSRQLLIRGNTIINPGMEAIQIHAFGEHPAHEEIEISDNGIRSDADPVIYIGGLAGGKVKNNRIERMDGSRVANPAVFEHCRDVLMDD